MTDAILFTIALFIAALTIYAAADWLAYRRRLRADAELAGVLTRPVTLPSSLGSNDPEIPDRCILRELAAGVDVAEVLTRPVLDDEER